MRALLPLALLMTFAGASLGACPPSTELAKVDGETITLSYYKYVEELLPEWALKKYYGGERGRKELLEKIVQRNLILVDSEKRGLFNRKDIKRKVERFKIKSLAYSYINQKLKGIKVTRQELRRALEKYPEKERTPDRIKSLKASILANKYVSKRQELLDRVKKEIKIVNTSPEKDSDVVSVFRGRKITYSELSPLIEGKPTEKKIEKAVETYALYLLALSQGLDKRPEFKNSVRALKERIAVREFEKQLLSSVRVTDREIKAYYEANRSKFKTPGTAKVKIFVFKNLKEAERSLKKLKGGVGEKKAIPPGVLVTGREWLVSSDDRNNPVSQLVFSSKERFQLLSMPDGRVLLIEVREKRKPQPMPYGDAYSRVRQELLSKKVKEALKERMEELRRKYGSQIYEKNLRCLGQ